MHICTNDVPQVVLEPRALSQAPAPMVDAEGQKLPERDTEEAREINPEKFNTLLSEIDTASVAGAGGLPQAAPSDLMAKAPPIPPKTLPGRIERGRSSTQFFNIAAGSSTAASREHSSGTYYEETNIPTAKASSDITPPAPIDPKEDLRAAAQESLSIAVHMSTKPRSGTVETQVGNSSTPQAFGYHFDPPDGLCEFSGDLAHVEIEGLAMPCHHTAS